ncbi:MAG: glycerol-3-phosphate dehydrogenase, partial [Rhodospirillales bacterium]|nr:glycerol-3-phosphate dehydrogenase [Rhodospirillales bacterium]
KITTYRCLAEQVLNKIRLFLPNMGSEWTWSVPLPGGDVPGGSYEHLLDDLTRAYPALDTGLVSRMARRHGTRSFDILGDAKKTSDLGADFGAGLCAREVDFVMKKEWAREAEDVLWRRTKCGLHMDQAGRDAVAEYVAAH